MEGGRPKNPVKNVCTTPLVGGQWKKGKKFKYELNIVYNKSAPNIPLDSPFEPISPNSLTVGGAIGRPSALAAVRSKSLHGGPARTRPGFEVLRRAQGRGRAQPRGRARARRWP